MAVSSYGSNTIVTSALVAATEAVVSSISSLGDTGEGLGATVRGVINVTGGAGLTTATIRVRQGGVAGTAVYTSPAIPLTASVVEVPLAYEAYDPAPVAGTLDTYSVTVTTAGGPATVNNANVSLVFHGTD